MEIVTDLTPIQIVRPHVSVEHAVLGHYSDLILNMDIPYQVMTGNVANDWR